MGSALFSCETAVAWRFAVVIKQSFSKQVGALVADLQSDRAVAREAAAARLAVIGARAVERVATVARDRSNSTAARVAAIGTLEAIEDPHAADIVLPLANDADPDVARAAIRALRPLLRGPHGVRALECLTTVALDQTRADEARVTAVQVMGELDPKTVKPLFDRLREDPRPAIAALATSGATSVGRQRSSKAAPVSSGPAAPPFEDSLPEDPEPLRHQLSRDGPTAPLTTLHRLVERVREREAQDPARRSAWMTARAAAHLALATRGSRLALYDLRETLESTREPLAVEFLAALKEIGDVSCLEAIAAAYAHAPAETDWWRSHLLDAFRAIVAREGTTQRHPTAKKIAKRWPGAYKELWG